MDNNIRISQGAAYFESDQSVVFQFVGAQNIQTKDSLSYFGGLSGNGVFTGSRLRIRHTTN